jgi:hypothetical protein
MARYVFSPFYPVADNWQVSHRAGWAAYWSEELGAKLLTTKNAGQVRELVKKGDEVYVYHGMEFNGGMNLQGGLTEEIYGRCGDLTRLIKGPSKLISLDIPMPNYGELFLKRKETPEFSELSAELSAEIRHSLIPMLGSPPKAENLIVGDSHSLSLYRPGSAIIRLDGQTLYGALQTKLSEIVVGGRLSRQISGPPRKITFYFGNIDLRHHLARNGSATVKWLVAEYIKQVVQCKSMCPDIEIALPLAINDDSRRLPKTGYFKGTPFYGSWNERQELYVTMCSELIKGAKKAGIEIYRHPKHFNNEMQQLSVDALEKPQSVHIRPSEYRLMQEGGQWHI